MGAAAGSAVGSCHTMRLGPTDPSRTNVEEDPGPPLKRNVTGRVASGCSPSGRAMKSVWKTLAAGLTFFVSMCRVATLAS